MCDVARVRFAEYMVGDCMADQTAQVNGVGVDFLCQVGIADFALDGNGFGDFEVVYGMEGEVVDGL